MSATLDLNRAGPGIRCTGCLRTFRSQQNGGRHVLSCGSATSLAESQQGDTVDSEFDAGGGQHAGDPDGDYVESSVDDEDANSPERGMDDAEGSDDDAGIEQGVDIDHDGSECEEGDEDGLPHLKNLHKDLPEYKDAKCVDGGDPKFAFDALGSDCFPWRNLTEMLVGIWAIIHRPSRKSLQMLLDLLRFVDRQGSRFDPKHVPCSSEHLISRMRKRLPHLPVFERIVKDKEGEPSRAFDIPFNLLLDRLLSCPRVVEEMRGNFGGHVLSASERAENNVPDTHITPIATELHDKAYETHLNGELLRSSSHMGL